METLGLLGGIWDEEEGHRKERLPTSELKLWVLHNFAKGFPTHSHIAHPQYPHCNEVVSSQQYAHLSHVILMTTCY